MKQLSLQQIALILTAVLAIMSLIGYVNYGFPAHRFDFVYVRLTNGADKAQLLTSFKWIADEVDQDTIVNVEINVRQNAQVNYVYGLNPNRKHTCTLEVMDAHNNMVINEKLELIPGQTYENMDIAMLPAGDYVVLLEEDGKCLKSTLEIMQLDDVSPHR